LDFSFFSDWWIDGFFICKSNTMFLVSSRSSLQPPSDRVGSFPARFLLRCDYVHKDVSRPAVAAIDKAEPSGGICVLLFAGFIAPSPKPATHCDFRAAISMLLAALFFAPYMTSYGIT